MKVNRRTFLVLQSSFALRCGWASATDWEHDVTDMLNQFLSCQTPIDDRSPCNYFLARAVKKVYSVDDFFLAPDKPMSANAIAAFVAADQKWTSLGSCDKQLSLDQAQGYANLKKPVVAVYVAQPHGHVALILPGSASKSQTWGMQVPNSASFPLDAPQKAYVAGPLSKAFGPDKKTQVTLYGRNFVP
ncbi:hypothetical protein [Occallatibacter savannae]|uniref:hypothetical protein n=1 Tax=Occallatibacter savannae TaxID=1002691 RepID=UPI0013A59777|nr:hypothetical protein [Occallatibacter savannae]